MLVNFEENLPSRFLPSGPQQSLVARRTGQMCLIELTDLLNQRAARLRHANHPDLSVPAAITKDGFVDSATAV